jgi:DNA-binding NarL/FixJ family response regulator
VIIDLFMPEKEGLETIKEMGQMRPEQKVIDQAAEQAA